LPTLLVKLLSGKLQLQKNKINALLNIIFSNYAALTYSVPTAHDAPSSLQSFTEDELMLKETGKKKQDLGKIIILNTC
jgi:hypothetical protein